VDDLLEIMRSLSEDGRSLIFISHKLQEVTSICGRIAVLRDGRLVDIVLSTSTTRKELARLMVGREVLLRVEKEPASPGEVQLSVRDLHVVDHRGLPALRGIDLDVRAGEIVGVAGVAGNGQRELEDALSGLRGIEAGQIRLTNHDITNRSPRYVLNSGLGHIPADRFGMGLLRDFTVADNLVLDAFYQAPFTRWGLLDRRAISTHAARLVRDYDIRTAATSTEVSKLSGGNAQKIILAREIAREPKVLIAAQPTRGLDVGATEFVHRELVRQRDRGMAILLISTELEEILSLSDRIVVLYEGRIVGELAVEDADVAELGLMMAGSRPDPD
jgi:simple sugar transport system ATP-binding protein